MVARAALSLVAVMLIASCGRPTVETITLTGTCTLSFPERASVEPEASPELVTITFDDFPGRALRIASANLGRIARSGSRNVPIELSVRRWKECIAPGQVLRVDGVAVEEDEWPSILVLSDTSPPGWCDRSPWRE